MALMNKRSSVPHREQQRFGRCGSGPWGKLCLGFLDMTTPDRRHWQECALLPRSSLSGAQGGSCRSRRCGHSLFWHRPLRRLKVSPRRAGNKQPTWDCRRRALLPGRGNPQGTSRPSWPSSVGASSPPRGYSGITLRPCTRPSKRTPTPEGEPETEFTHGGGPCPEQLREGRGRECSASLPPGPGGSAQCSW